MADSVLGKSIEKLVLSSWIGKQHSPTTSFLPWSMKTLLFQSPLPLLISNADLIFCLHIETITKMSISVFYDGGFYHMCVHP